MDPTPELIPLLVKHGISLELFSKKGRPPKWVREKRQAVVTELHLRGLTWKDMSRVTGLSVMSISNLTLGVGNPASRKNRADSAAKVGASRKGELKPWLSKKLKVDWEQGVFDFHKGRKRSQAERDTLRKAAQRPEVKQQRSTSATNLWRNPVFRSKLLVYHRFEANRVRLSQAQTTRMIENPTKWVRGKAGWCDTPKCVIPRVWTRSSYERAFILILEADPNVACYQVEPRITLDCGRWILPDFLVTYLDSSKSLIEVKASWVFSLPKQHRVQLRLSKAASVAIANHWDFRVWTEKGFHDANYFSEEQT